MKNQKIRNYLLSKIVFSDFQFNSRNALSESQITLSKSPNLGGLTIVLILNPETISKQFITSFTLVPLPVLKLFTINQNMTLVLVFFQKNFTCVERRDWKHENKLNLYVLQSSLNLCWFCCSSEWSAAKWPLARSCTCIKSLTPKRKITQNSLSVLTKCQKEGDWGILLSKTNLYHLVYWTYRHKYKDDLFCLLRLHIRLVSSFRVVLVNLQSVHSDHFHSGLSIW